MTVDEVVAQSLPPSEAARRIGVSCQRIRQLAMNGELPHIWTPIGRLYDPAGVERARQARQQRRDAARPLSAA